MKLTSKKNIGFIAGILVLGLIVGVWAYFTSTSSIDNLLHTNSYGAKTQEEFTPGQVLEPGKEIEKKVAVTNTGDYDLVVRVSFAEKWARDGIDFKTIAYDGNIDTVEYSAGPPKAWTTSQDDATDGLTTLDNHSVVYKTFNPNDDWIKGDDGYWYFKTKLTSGQSTGNLLESIILASNTDIGKYEVTTYYSIANKVTIADAIAYGIITETMYDWTTTKPDDDLITFMKSESAVADGFEGYANADYTLTITTEVCQATKEAVDGSWTMTTGNLLDIKSAWALD